MKINSKEVRKSETLKVKNINNGRLGLQIKTLFGPFILLLITKFDFLLQIFAQIGEICRFYIWQRDQFKTVPIYLSKKKFYSAITQELIDDPKPTDFYEFGVAHGYATNYFINNHKFETQILHEYNAYDTFEGLNKPFREFPEGSFTNKGLVPAIFNKKLNWYIGLVEKNFTGFTHVNCRKVIFFDLDLHEPTLFVMEKILKSLLPGDFIYFDEGFDLNEFSIIEDYVMKKFKVRLVGTNFQAVCFQIIK
jgi:hypothetical protein